MKKILLFLIFCFISSCSNSHIVDYEDIKKYEITNSSVIPYQKIGKDLYKVKVLISLKNNTDEQLNGKLKVNLILSEPCKGCIVMFEKEVNLNPNSTSEYYHITGLYYLNQVSIEKIVFIEN